VRLVVIAVLVVAAVAIFLTSPVFQPPPAKERLADVSVALDGFQVTDIDETHHTLRLDLEVSAAQDIPDLCLGFALDEPFATRRLRLTDPAGGCLRPAAGTTRASVDFDGLTDIDLMSPSHTLVWGVDGGRCSLPMQAFGVCVVEQAGTVPVELPPPPGLPSFPPLGSLPPFFEPFSFDPP
jgi:hypothetical protein